MIDWVTALLPCLHVPIDAGYVTKTTTGGEIEWQTRCRDSVKNSYDQGITIKSDGGNGEDMATHLLISGNPSKFLQGHNVFGSCELIPLLFDVYMDVCAAKGLQPSQEETASVQRGDYRIINIDFNQSFELPSRADVLAWIRGMEFKAKTRHGRPSRKGGTLYFGKGSSRWKMKFYCKGEELDAGKQHKLPDELEHTPIKGWADNKLRGELTLLAKELKELGLTIARDLTRNVLKSIFFEYLRKIDMNEQMTLSSEEQMGLPTKLQSTYLHWINGVDLRGILPESTYYRHRKGLLEHGIDIAIRKETADRSNVIPMIRVLEAKPASIPLWAFEQGLVHHSAMRA